MCEDVLCAWHRRVVGELTTMGIGLCGGLVYRVCVVLRCIWRFGCVGGVGATTATIGRLLLGVLVALMDLRPRPDLCDARRSGDLSLLLRPPRA